ncbi:unnamed protein product [Amoebophrya sp. A120]|nr:unnamed protein product [Amoebophrya sp. A120]|eukprot:GSA120T00007821001.1
MSSSPRGPAQPVFSRRGASHQVSDPGLLRRGLKNVIQVQPEQSPKFGSSGAEQQDSAGEQLDPQVNGDPDATNPDVNEEDVLTLDPELAKKQIKAGFSQPPPDTSSVPPPTSTGATPSASSTAGKKKSQPKDPNASFEPSDSFLQDQQEEENRDSYLDREFLESAISTYNRLAEHARNKQHYKLGISHLRRALSLEKSGVVPPDDWPLKVLLAKTQVNVATLQYLLNQPHESLLEAALARDRSLECLNYLDSEVYSARKGQEDPDLLFLLEESAVTFCLALHSAALAMKQLPGADTAGITEVDRLAWKIGTKYLDRGHPCLSFMRKAFETRNTLPPEETAAFVSPQGSNKDGAGPGDGGDESQKDITQDKQAAQQDKEKVDPDAAAKQDQADENQQEQKRKMLISELEDLQQYLRDTVLSDEKELNSIWDDIQVVKQKAVNFELNLPEIATLEAEVLRSKRRMALSTGSGSMLGHIGKSASSADLQKGSSSSSLEANKGASSGGEGGAGPAVGKKTAGQKKKRSKSADRSSGGGRLGATTRMDLPEMRRQRENLKHEKTISRLITRTADEQYLYEVRMSYSKAKATPSKSRPQLAASAPGGAGPHGGKGGAQDAAGKKYDLKKDVISLTGILKHEHETLLTWHPQGKEIAASLDPSYAERQTLNRAYADSLGSLAHKGRTEAIVRVSKMKGKAHVLAKHVAGSPLRRRSGASNASSPGGGK